MIDSKYSMSHNEIPNIEFDSNKANRGFEIITLENLARRSRNLDHDPEKAHQVAFNLLVYYVCFDVISLLKNTRNYLYSTTIINNTKLTE